MEQDSGSIPPQLHLFIASHIQFKFSTGLLKSDLYVSVLCTPIKTLFPLI